MVPPHEEKPVIEESPGAGAEDVTHRSLRQRIRQQEILAELGVAALKGAPFEQLLNMTARSTAEGLQCKYCKVLQYIPSEKRLFVRAGVGWGPEVVGKASSEPLLPEDPNASANRRLSILLMREAPPAPPGGAL